MKPGSRRTPRGLRRLRPRWPSGQRPWSPSRSSPSKACSLSWPPPKRKMSQPVGSTSLYYYVNDLNGDTAPLAALLDRNNVSTTQVPVEVENDYLPRKGGGSSRRSMAQHPFQVTRQHPGRTGPPNRSRSHGSESSTNARLEPEMALGENSNPRVHLTADVLCSPLQGRPPPWLAVLRGLARFVGAEPWAQKVEADP